MQDGLIRCEQEQAALRFGRLQAALNPEGVLRQAQLDEKRGKLFHQFRVGHSEIEQVPRDLDGRRRHPRAEKLLSPEEIGAFQLAVTLWSRFGLVNQFGLLDRILVLLLRDQPLELNGRVARGCLDHNATLRLTFVGHDW